MHFNFQKYEPNTWGKISAAIKIRLGFVEKINKFASFELNN